MNDNTKRIIASKDIWAIVLATLLISLIFLMSLQCAPIADDWSFYDVSKLDMWSILDTCMHHTGRIGQWLVIAVGMKIFGMNAVRVLPIFMFLALCLFGTLILREFSILKKTNLTVFYCVLLFSSFIFLLPSIHDSFLWYDSSASYIMSIVFLEVWIFLAIKIIGQEKVGLLKLLLLYSIAAFSQLFSEPTSILSIGAVVMIFVCRLSKKKKFDFIQWHLLGLTISLMVGFLILYFSPGSIERRANEWSEFTFVSNIIEPLLGYKMIIGGLNIANVLLILVSGLFFGCEIKKKFLNKKIFIVLSCIAVYVTYGVFWINNYSQNYMPYRILTLPTFALSIWIVYSIALVFNRLLDRMRCRILPYVLMASVLLLSIVMVRDGSYIISGLSLRRHFVNYRDRYVELQLAEDRGIIEIPEVPLKLKGNAEDMYYYIDEYGNRRMIWVAQNYINHIGANDKNCILISLPEYQ